MDINRYISSGVVELYVLGLCTEEEKIEIETARKQYPAVDEAITRYETSLEEGLQNAGYLPPPYVDDKVLRQIDKLGAPAASLAGNSKSGGQVAWLKFTAAAAVILFVLSSVFNIIIYRKWKQLSDAPVVTTTSATLPAGDYAVMTNPSITPVAMNGVGIHAICRCTLYWDKKTGKAYIMIHHLVPSSESRDYQLWAMVEGKPVSVGVINDAIRGRFIQVSNVPAATRAFIVTLEKAGGTDAPTESETYLRGTL